MPDPLNPHYDDPAVIYDSGFFYADAVVPAPTPTPTPKRMAKLKLNTSRMTPAQLIALADVVLPKIAPTAPATPPVPNVAAKATPLETKRDAAHAANEAYEAAKAGLPALKVARRARLRNVHGHRRRSPHYLSFGGDGGSLIWSFERNIGGTLQGGESPVTECSQAIGTIQISFDTLLVNPPAGWV